MIPAPQRLIVSLHIPKTGGTSFAAVLQRAFPGQVAYLYKPYHPRTHPLLRERGKTLEPTVLARLEADGVRVLHGHGALSLYAEAAPDLGRVWTWLRDPVERVISSYFYQSSRSERAGSRPEMRDRVVGRSLADYARMPANRNLQSRILGPIQVDSLGFVGITEMFDESLALLGLSRDRTKMRNINNRRPEVSEADRELIAHLNQADIALYAQAVDLHNARITGSASSPRTC